MLRQKLRLVGWNILWMLLLLLVGLILFFGWKSGIQDTYQKSLCYSETLYEEYQKEAERMIAEEKFTYQYPHEVVPDIENNRGAFIIKIGNYNEGCIYSDYMTVTVKNYGTSEQEVIFKRSRESAQEAYEQAEEFKNGKNTIMVWFWLIIAFAEFLFIWDTMRTIKRYRTESNNSHTTDCEE